MRNVLFMALFHILIPGIVLAQLSIKGVVTDKSTNQPLPGAHIQVKGTLLNNVSDVNGNFLLKSVPKGNYDLQVSYIGYNTQILNIELTEDTNVSIRLSRSALMQDVVIIRSTRAGTKTPVSYTNIPKKTIKKINLGKDLPYLLSYTPSLVTSSDAGNDVGYTSFRIRGTDMTRINVTINGIPLNDSESHNVFWVDLPDLASSVDNIQIQRGVGTSTNGAAAFGASVNIQTNALEQNPYAVIDQSFGSFNTYKSTFAAGTGLLKDRFTFDARYSLIRSDGYIDRATTNMNSYYLSGGFYSEKTILRLNILSGDEVTYQAWEGVPSYLLETNRTYNPAGEYTDINGNTQYYENQTDNYKQDHYQLFLSHSLSPVFLVNLGIHYTRGEGYYESYKTGETLANYGDGYFVPDTAVTSSDLVRQKWLDNHFSGITFSGNYNSGKKLELTFGGSFNIYSGDHFGYVIWAQDALIVDKDKPYYFNTGDKSDINLFAKGNYTINSKLSAFADLQYRHIKYKVNGKHDNLQTIAINKDFNFLNPKAGIYFDIDNSNSTYVSFGLAHREPNRRNYIDADEGYIPTREILYDYELGYRINRSKIAAGINLFYMDYTDQLVLTGEINNVGDPIMVNVPNSYRTGIEIDAQLKPWNFFDWMINIALSSNKIKEFTSYVDNWDSWGQEKEQLTNTDLSFSPSVILNSQLNFTILDGFIATLATKYVGKQYIDNTSSEERKLDPYLLNDIILSYIIETDIIDEIGIKLLFNNIFNEKYESNAWVYRYIFEGQEGVYDGYFPQAMFNFQAGVHLRF